MRGPPLCVRVSGVRVKMNLWQKVTFASPGPDLALKHLGVLRLEVLLGLRRNYFVFCLNFIQVNQINQSYGPKSSFLIKWSFGGIFSHKSPPGDENQIPKTGEW